LIKTCSIFCSKASKLKPRTIHNQAQLDTLKREKDAILVLFGGENCGVCQTIKPQINANFSDKLTENLYACRSIPDDSF
jgi:thioredoxin-related protein